MAVERHARHDRCTLSSSTRCRGAASPQGPAHKCVRTCACAHLTLHSPARTAERLGRRTLWRSITLPTGCVTRGPVDRGCLGAWRVFGAGHLYIMGTRAHYSVPCAGVWLQCWSHVPSYGHAVLQHIKSMSAYALQIYVSDLLITST